MIYLQIRLDWKEKQKEKKQNRNIKSRVLVSLIASVRVCVCVCFVSLGCAPACVFRLREGENISGMICLLIFPSYFFLARNDLHFLRRRKIASFVDIQMCLW